MAVSILQQLLPLYFVIIYNWQLSSSEKQGKKIHPYISRILQIYISLTQTFFFSFSLANACLPRRLRKAYALLWAANRFVGSETPKRNSFDQFLKFKFHFKNSPRYTQLLGFNGPNNYLYLINNHQQTFSWPGERKSSPPNLTKTWFGPPESKTINSSSSNGLQISLKQ